MINGIINVYKEPGFTSHDVVAKLRGICGQKKIGHTGTLDPDASGVLPVCLGNATKLCGMLTDKSKEYRAVLLLGIETDTQDTGGAVLQKRFVSVKEDEVRSAIASFAGEYDQIPPMYSALKVNGQKLCDLARAGKEVERKSRRVTIHSIRIEDVSLPYVTMTVACSRGTYIRTLCHDIGQKLGCGGAMAQLLRTRSGPFFIGGAHKLCEIENIVREGRLSEILFPTDGMFSALPAYTVKPEGERTVHNGNMLPLRLLEKKEPEKETCALNFLRPAGRDGMENALPEYEAAPEGMDGAGNIRVYDTEGRFCGIYGRQTEEEAYRPVKMFLSQERI